NLPGLGIDISSPDTISSFGFFTSSVMGNSPLADRWLLSSSSPAPARRFAVLESATGLTCAVAALASVLVGRSRRGREAAHANHVLCSLVTSNRQVIQAPQRRALVRRSPETEAADVWRRA